MTTRDKHVPLDKLFLNRAFRLLAQRFEEANIFCEICVYGGSALVYAYELRGMSMDVDYRIVSLNSNSVPKDMLMQTVRKIIERTGAELGLSSDWMNDGVKGFAALHEEYNEGVAFGETAIPSLKIMFPTPEYLLAMKCLSMRNESESAHDKQDILQLIQTIGIDDPEQVMDVVQKFYLLNQLSPRISYGIQEIMATIQSDIQVEQEEQEEQELNDAYVPEI